MGSNKEGDVCVGGEGGEGKVLGGLVGKPQQRRRVGEGRAGEGC